MAFKTLEGICTTTQDILRRIDHRSPEESASLNRTALSGKLHVLRTDLQHLLDIKKDLRPIVPAFIMRQWAFASIRKALKKIALAEQAFIDSSDELFLRETTLAALWAYQAASLFHLRNILKEVPHDMDRFIFDHQMLKKGDVVLSYKTKAYLRKDILAKLVAITTNSSITHSLITTGSGTTAKLLCSSPEKNGINLLSPIPKQGEVYIVMRLKDTDAPYIKLVEQSIDTWKERIDSLYVCKFSEFKSWVASALGFVYVLSVYVSQRPIIIRNFAKNQQGLFCSEIIDTIFKEAGILLTPRSEHDALVGPVEFFHSPYLALQGFIINEEDREIIKEELIQQFDLR